MGKEAEGGVEAREHSLPGRNSKYPLWLFCKVDMGGNNRR